MSPDDPRHGTYAGYQVHKKAGEKDCEPCNKARSRYDKTREVYGLQSTTVIGPEVYRIVKDVPPKALCAATGLSEKGIRSIKKRGPEGRCMKSTKARILAVGRPLTPVGARRRLQALAALGWSGRVVADVAGLHPDSINSIRSGEVSHYLRAGVAEKIADAYAELSMKVPPRTRHTAQTVSRAVSRGWAVPLAWDDGEIDDPKARPRGVAKLGHITPRKADEDCSECPRCGVRRQVRVQARGSLCPDCRSVEREAS